MNFTKYINDKNFNEIVVTFKNGITKKHRDEIWEALQNFGCKQSGDIPVWQKSYKDSTKFYCLRVQTDIIRGADMYYRKKIEDYYRKEMIKCDFHIISFQDLLLTLEENSDQDD